MQDRRKDEQAGRAIVASTAALGIVAGFALGILLAVPLAELHLKRYLSRVATQEAASVREAHSLLSTLQQSSYAACSDGELASFRELVFRSQYIKDAGHMHAGAIDCSATAGRPSHPIGPFQSATTSQDGVIAYANLVPARDAGLNRTGFQLGSTFVVLSPSLPVPEGSLPMHLTVHPIDAT